MLKIYMINKKLIKNKPLIEKDINLKILKEINKNKTM